MKKINFKIYFLLISLMFIAASCGEDFLDRTPKHGYTAGNYYENDDAVIKAIEPLYNYAWSGYNERAIVGMGSFRANDAWSPYLQGEFARFTITGLTDVLINAWSSLYMVVSMSNQLLLDMDVYATSGVSEAVKNQARGEAYLMRGAAYFYLLRGWGEVILYEDNIDITSRPVRPLNTEESVLKFIVRDFERAAELLPERGANFHPSRYVAKAMLAKALLAQSGWNKGGQRDEATLQRVVSLCDEVINCGQYHLLDNYENLFRPQYNDNEETLLAMRWADPLLGEYASSNNLISDLAWSDVCDVNCWGGSLHASVDMINYYNEEPADSFRLRGTFFTPGRHYDYIWSEKGGYTYNVNWIQAKKGVVGTKADCDGHLAQQASPLNLEYCNWYDMVTWYRWRPQYMLDFFNHKQHRAFMLNSGDVIRNDDGTLSYRCVFPGTNNWYFYDDQGHCYWSDCLRMSDDDQTVVQTKAQGYVYDLDALSEARGADYSPIVLSEANIFMPYPEADVIQNPYFNQPPVEYDFSEK